tara:strand:+ start:40 stop:441 length:402 start_codon:yes stop_codon:yes gene_type:complete
MKLRNTAIAAALSLVPLGQPFFFWTGAVWTSAAVMLSVPQTVNAETAYFYFQRANKKGQKGDYSGAISDYDKVIEINPRYANAYIKRGTVFRLIGKFDEAFVDCNTVIDLEPENDLSYAWPSQMLKDLDHNIQ